MVGGGGYGRLFERIISLENLLAAWREFKRGKSAKLDVQEFYSTLEENLFEIRASLKAKTYRPDPYTSFFVRDPKLRHIHKASVRDRVLYQAVFRVLYSCFDETFVHDSYSCRLRKGTHRGVAQLKKYLRKATANYHRPAHALKGDVRKFFDSVDHDILLRLLEKKIADEDARWLVRLIVKSFGTAPHKGLPLGNVTSQLFANVYLNEFDQWAKHVLKAKWYLRYCDDFVVLDQDKTRLEKSISLIEQTLQEKLKLSLHPRKVSIQKVSQGVDFLGYVLLPHATMLRTNTKRRILKKVSKKNLPSYLGVLSHADARKLREEIKRRAK